MAAEWICGAMATMTLMVVVAIGLLVNNGTGRWRGAPQTLRLHPDRDAYNAFKPTT
jgi:hypothetical protein